MLAPMAGISNWPFRLLVQRFQPNVLAISEMINARAIVERNPKTNRLMEFHPEEQFRAVQLFSNNAADLKSAVEIIGRENRADHIDLNFGCPVPKVTRKGGGAAIPLKPELLREMLFAVKTGSADFGITMSAKFRIGIDDQHQTYLRACQIANEVGVDFITLHARTAEQYYGGEADWSVFNSALGETNLPVFLNGDIFSPADAVALLEQVEPQYYERAGLACARGALGRPWLFKELSRMPNLFEGIRKETRNQAQATRPATTVSASGIPKVPESYSEIRPVMLEHLQLLMEYYRDETMACKDFRKHTIYYLKGFNIGAEYRRQLALLDNYQQLEQLLSQLEQLLSQLEDQRPELQTVGTLKRGKTKGSRKVHLPYGWLSS
ncbi:MAG: tRNA-dihydrouridine synthase family protein [Bifidobacteriaceae bacterium]|jgi:nifR3 family TIM-barrel protein|nr:tRNA-dihydrouridine synthase family protein [Bifidobacteriaceae bacterium]